jgi:hypothetical protein
MQVKCGGNRKMVVEPVAKFGWGQGFAITSRRYDKAFDFLEMRDLDRHHQSTLGLDYLRWVPNSLADVLCSLGCEAETHRVTLPLTASDH